jgi:hypothetical protein
MLSADVISFLPLISNELAIGSAHRLLETLRGIGEHSMQIGTIYSVTCFCPFQLRERRFADRDAFARFSGIGIGCQRLQATHALEITIGPDAPDSAGPVASEFENGLFDGCYKIDDEDDGDL